MSAIRKSLLQLMFSGSYMRRWNDKLRPVELYEIDKQAHKMFYAYVLAQCEGSEVDRLKLVEGGIFEFFHRGVLTDIKPPIYHKLIKEKGRQIDKWVLEQLREMTDGIGGGFFDRMERYFMEDDYSALEKKILKAAEMFLERQNCLNLQSLFFLQPRRAIRSCFVRL